MRQLNVMSNDEYCAWKRAEMRISKANRVLLRRNLMWHQNDGKYPIHTESPSLFFTIVLMQKTKSLQALRDVLIKQKTRIPIRKEKLMIVNEILQRRALLKIARKTGVDRREIPKIDPKVLALLDEDDEVSEVVHEILDGRNRFQVYCEQVETVSNEKAKYQPR